MRRVLRWAALAVVGTAGAIVGSALLAIFGYVVFDLARDAASDAGASTGLAAVIGGVVVAALAALVATGHGEWGE